VHVHGAGSVVGADAFRRPAPQGTRLAAGADGCGALLLRRADIEPLGAEAVFSLAAPLELLPRAAARARARGGAGGAAGG